MINTAGEAIPLVTTGEAIPLVTPGLTLSVL